MRHLVRIQAVYEKKKQKLLVRCEQSRVYSKPKYIADNTGTTYYTAADIDIFTNTKRTLHPILPT